MYEKSDRCKIRDGRGKGSNNWGGVRGGEVERKIQRCREKLTDAAIEWEMRGKGWVVRGYGLVSFLCIWMWIEAVGVGAAGKGEAELG